MRPLQHKLWRDVFAQRGSSLAVGTVMALGVLLFVATAAAYLDLRDSYADTRRELALAGLHVDLAGPLDDATLAEVRALPQVAAAETRTVAEVPVSPTTARRRRAALRVLSLPDVGQPALDKVLVLEGALPGANEVLLEKHFARAHGFTAGSELPLGEAGSLRVSGVAVSAEYLWVARDENDFFTSADEFGVGWMRAGAAAQLAAPRVQLLVAPRSGVSPASVTPALDALLGARVVRATAAADLPGVKLLQMDVDGYRGMAAFFPFFFLGVGAFIMGSVLARMVDAQRALIGTFLALGVSRGAIVRHYLGVALVLGGSGAVLGAVLGLVAAPAMTHAYAEELNIPFVHVGVHQGLMLQGIAMGLVVAVLAGLLPALRAMRLVPADAMRPPRPSVSRWARSLRSLALPLPLRLAVRDVFDRPLRSLGTVFGVAAAVVLVLATGVLMDSMRTSFTSLFSTAVRYDTRVDFAELQPSDAVLATARTVEGVRSAEALLVVPARFEAGGRTVEGLLQALEPDAALLRAVDANGDVVTPRAGGVVLTRSMARTLGVTRGARVRLVPLAGGEPLSLELVGFGDAAMGNTATVLREALDGPWQLRHLATTVLTSTVPTADASNVRAALVHAFPQAARVEDTAATRALFDQMMGLGRLMILLMLVFGGVLAGAVLFNTATLLVLERQRELATLRALGLRMAEVTTLVTAQHALLAVIGLGVGLPLAVGASKVMLAAFSGELFALPFVLSMPTVVVTLVGVFLVVMLAQWPALRRVGHASLADAVRERS